MGRIDKAYNFKTKIDNFKLFIEKIKIPILCNIANNHVYDYGDDCFKDTLLILEENKVFYTGYSKNLNIDERITFIKIKQKIIAFIGAFNGNNVNKYKEGLTAIDDNLYKKVKYAKDKSDYVIVHLHWGEELS